MVGDCGAYSTSLFYQCPVESSSSLLLEVNVQFQRTLVYLYHSFKEFQELFMFIAHNVDLDQSLKSATSVLALHRLPRSF